MPITPIIPGVQVRAAYASAPEPVKDSFDSERTTDVIIALQERYKVHVDVIGELGKEVGYLLLGLTSPVEFVERLKRGGLDADTANQIAASINREIFVPLRDAMRQPHAGEAHASAPAAGREPAPIRPTVRAQASSAPEAPVVPLPTLVVPTPPPVASVPLPPPAAISAPTLPPRPTEPYIPPTPPVPPPTPAPIPAPLPTTPTAPAWTPPPAPQEPTMRTMAHDVEFMKAGVAPAPTPYHAAVPVAPAPQPIAMPAPTQAAPTHSPVMPPPPSIPTSQMPVSPEIARVPAKTPAPDLHEVTATLQKYGIDPYREAPE